MQNFKYLLLAFAVLSSSLTACSNTEASKTPADAINVLIKAYAANDLNLIQKSLGSNHRFGSNIIEELQWLGNCLKMVKDSCIKTPVEVIETKTVESEIATAVMAKNLLGAPMSVWFITSLENGSYKVTGMNTRLECALKTPEQKAKDLKERKPGDYNFC